MKALIMFDVYDYINKYQVNKHFPPFLEKSSDIPQQCSPPVCCENNFKCKYCKNMVEITPR